MMIRRFAAAAALATVTVGAGAGVAGAATATPESSSDAATGIVADLQGILGADRPQLEGDAPAQSSAPQSSDALSGIVADLQGLLGVDRPQLDLGEKAAPARPALLPTGQNAVKRVLALEEQKAGHKLMDIQFIDGNRAHISFAPEYDLQKDNDALVNVTKALQINGFSVTADR
ncbi:hypothetical protein [Corynebacterium bovis]|uniref:Uncharacterized protein n=1 Tax=Corynebacterium bovis TaxID=36808 RepID=A0A426Q0Q4_9CORY|nr:hypothetical protein [Corynebacterium bovis]MDN8580264.1 hypothetical protein [Corynebacterium bovis]RRO84148.1 hypothetical protein CXF30_10290 [Corynebacterium bovis]RRO87630.1 hypothetical protein CXF48_01565 [Corynebacterium bovis]